MHIFSTLSLLGPSSPHIPPHADFANLPPPASPAKNEKHAKHRGKLEFLKNEGAKNEERGAGPQAKWGQGGRLTGGAPPRKVVLRVFPAVSFFSVFPFLCFPFWGEGLLRRPPLETKGKRGCFQGRGAKG